MKSKDSTFAPLKAPKQKQTQIYYRKESYSAFPHVIRLDGDEFLLAFREAPVQKVGGIRHTHPRSLITLIRSYDAGQSWDLENGTQVGAGGGQEFGLINLGKGKIGGALAAHEVAPEREAKRSRLPWHHEREYPFANVGGLWCWSDNHGLTWPLHQATMIAPGLQTCAPPIQLADGTLLVPSYGSVGRSKGTSAVLNRSIDEGRTWSDISYIARGRPQGLGFCEPALLELDPGHLICLHRAGTATRQGYFWQNESFDAGHTWTRPTETHILSGACPRVLKLQDGRILLTYGRRREPYGIYASFSEDGKTWSEDTWLLRATPNANQGYTSSLQLDKGRMFTTCYALNSRGVTGITGTFWTLPQ